LFFALGAGSTSGRRRC